MNADAGKVRKSMMLCSRCKKRPAVVLITAVQGNQKKNDGLCLVCAKEMNIPQVNEYMKQMGITDEELEQISNQMMDLMDGEGFEMGGSDVVPQFLQDMMKDAMGMKEEHAGSSKAEAEVVEALAPMSDGQDEPMSFSGHEYISKRERRQKRRKDL